MLQGRARGQDTTELGEVGRSGPWTRGECDVVADKAGGEDAALFETLGGGSGVHCEHVEEDHVAGLHVKRGHRKRVVDDRQLWEILEPASLSFLIKSRGLEPSPFMRTLDDS